MKKEVREKLDNKIVELNNILTNTSKEEGKLTEKAVSALSDLTKVWLEDVTQTLVDRKYVQNILQGFGEVNSNMKEGIIIGKNHAVKYSEYTTRILVDTGYAMSGYPTQFKALMEKVDIDSLTLADYLRLQKSLQKLGKYQNADVSQEKFELKNITTDGTKLFEMVKSKSVLDAEKAVAEGTKLSGHPAKILKNILREDAFQYDTEAHYIESVDEVLAKLKIQLIKNYEEAKTAEAEKAKAKAEKEAKAKVPTMKEEEEAPIAEAVS